MISKLSSIFLCCITLSIFILFDPPVTVGSLQYPDLGIPLNSSLPRSPRLTSSTPLYRTSLYGALELFATHFIFNYDQPLHLLDSFFCPSLHASPNPPDASCLSSPPFNSCDPPCNFTTPCQYSPSSSCCANLALTLNSGRPPCEWQLPLANGTNGLIPVVLSAGSPHYQLKNITASFSTNPSGYSRSFPFTYFAAFIDQPTSCNFMALLIRVRPTLGDFEVFVSKDSIFPNDIASPIIPLDPSAHVWRARYHGPGDDRVLSICFDDARGGPGTYFVVVKAQSAAAIFDIDMELIAYDASQLGAAPVAAVAAGGLGACEAAEGCTGLADGVAVEAALSKRRASYCAVQIAGPCMVHVQVQRPFSVSSVATSLFATVNASDAAVAYPMWVSHSPTTLHALSLSFLADARPLAFPLRLSIRLRATGFGNVSVLATTRAVFRVIPVATIPPRPPPAQQHGPTYREVGGPANNSHPR